MLKKSLVLCLFCLCFAALATAAEPDFLFVAATNVRIRANPATSAAVAATLPIGTWAKIVEKSAEKQDLLGKKDYWYKISADSQQGWIFGGLTLLASEDERFSKAIELINSRLTMTDKTVEDFTQVYEFASKIKELASHSAEKAKLELAFLKSIDGVCSALSRASKGRESTNKAISENPKIVYSHECAGQHFVEPSAYWELAEKYSDFPAMADEIAWAAANQPLQGETEGDPAAMVAVFELSTAAYIEKYPKGNYLSEAFERGAETLKYVTDALTPDYFAPTATEDKRMFTESLNKLEKVAMNCPESPAKIAYLKNLAEAKGKLTSSEATTAIEQKTEQE